MRHIDQFLKILNVKSRATIKDLQETLVQTVDRAKGNCCEQGAVE